jgi:hypothetical protein
MSASRVEYSGYSRVGYSIGGSKPMLAVPLRSAKGSLPFRPWPGQSGADLDAPDRFPAESCEENLKVWY